MRKIRVAQIGTSLNSHGNDIFSTFIRQSHNYEIAGYALPENEREKFPVRMPLFEGYKELTVEQILNDPGIEAVSVETEELYLTKYALMAAKAGKHIHCEKPGGKELSDFEALCAEMEKSGKVLHFGYMYRYNPVVSEIREKVKSGALGDIVTIDAQMNCIHAEGLRKWLGNFPGGMMFFLGCHLVDLAVELVGFPKEVIPLNFSTGEGGIHSFDVGLAVMKYDGCIATVKTSAVDNGGFARRQLVVNGTKGSVEIKPLEFYCENDKLYTVKTEFAENCPWNDKGVTTQSEPYGRYDGMMEAFAAMVRGDIQNPRSYAHELELYKTVLRACGMDI